MENLTTFGFKAEDNPVFDGVKEALTTKLRVQEVKDVLDSVNLDEGADYVNLGMKFIETCYERARRIGFEGETPLEATAREVLKTLRDYNEEEERRIEGGTLQVSNIHMLGAMSPRENPNAADVFVNACVYSLRQVDRKNRQAEENLESLLAASKS